MLRGLFYQIQIRCHSYLTLGLWMVSVADLTGEVITLLAVALLTLLLTHGCKIIYHTARTRFSLLFLLRQKLMTGPTSLSQYVVKVSAMCEGREGGSGLLHDYRLPKYGGRARFIFCMTYVAFSTAASRVTLHQGREYLFVRRFVGSGKVQPVF